MRLSDLVRDDLTGKMSHTKVWNQIGCASVIVAFNRAMWVKPELFAIDTAVGVAAAVGLLLGTSAGSKWLASKSGVRVDQEPPKP